MSRPGCLMSILLKEKKSSLPVASVHAINQITKEMKDMADLHWIQITDDLHNYNKLLEVPLSVK